MNPRIALALLLVGVLALGAVVLAASGGGDDQPVAAANEFAGRRRCRQGARAPDFELRDEEGKPVSMRALRGQPVVVTFLYSHCQDTCPITAQTIRGALDDLGHDVPALAISVDPPNDTPASARKFLAEQRANGRIRFVLGTRAELRPIWNDYGVTAPAGHRGAHRPHHARGRARLPARRLPDLRGDPGAAGARRGAAGAPVGLILLLRR